MSASAGDTTEVRSTSGQPTGSADCVAYAAYGRTCFGERVSGDTTVIERKGELLFAAIVDVLGHGREAHIVAQSAETFLRKSWSLDVVATIYALHDHLKGSRGAAVGICVLDLSDWTLSCVGVGNPSMRVFGHRPLRLNSVDGIVGGQFPPPRRQDGSLQLGEILLLHTDGVRERFEVKDYPQILRDSPRVIVRKMVSRFGKRYDDSTCIAIKRKR